MNTEPTVPVAGPAAGGEVAVRELRGRTVLADKVVEKIAAAAATEIDHATGLRRHVVGRAIGARAVRADVEVDGSEATLRLELAVDYPAPVRQVTRAVRSHVIDTVGRYCGLRVEHVDITVSALRPATTDRAGR